MKHFSIQALLFFTCISSIFSGFESIGVNYGFLGDNLPSPNDVISLLKSRNISKIRIFEPRQNVLQALQNSGISVIIGTRNEDLQPLASSAVAATVWLQKNVIPFCSSIQIRAISAGNEVETYPSLTQFIPDAMQNLKAALAAVNLNIPITTTTSMSVFASTYPPSHGAISEATLPVMKRVVDFLQSNKYPLIVNVYPFFPYISDPVNIPLGYALFDPNANSNPDGPFVYKNLFDSMLDAAYVALEKAGGVDVEVVVGETGWPTAGNSVATVENAKTYINNLVKHVASTEGTPRRPGKAIETYIFALFNENQKAEGVERNWGLYYPDKTEVYHVDF